MTKLEAICEELGKASSIIEAMRVYIKESNNAFNACRKDCEALEKALAEERERNVYSEMVLELTFQHKKMDQSPVDYLKSVIEKARTFDEINE